MYLRIILYLIWDKKQGENNIVIDIYCVGERIHYKDNLGIYNNTSNNSYKNSCIIKFLLNFKKQIVIWGNDSNRTAIELPHIIYVGYWIEPLAENIVYTPQTDNTRQLILDNSNNITFQTNNTTIINEINTIIIADSYIFCCSKQLLLISFN